MLEVSIEVSIVAATKMTVVFVGYVSMSCRLRNNRGSDGPHVCIGMV